MRGELTIATRRTIAALPMWPLKQRAGDSKGGGARAHDCGRRPRVPVDGFIESVVGGRVGEAVLSEEGSEV